MIQNRHDGRLRRLDNAVFGSLSRLDRRAGRLWHIVWHGASKGLVKKRTGSRFKDFINRVTYDIFFWLDRYDTNFFFRGRIYQTKTGRVRSKAEKKIANWLYDRGIEFEYERRLKLGGDVLSPDFYLVKYGVYLEYWGMSDSSESYDRRRKEKMRYYRAHSVKLISLYPRHLNQLDDEIPKQFFTLTGRQLYASRLQVMKGDARGKYGGGGE